MKNDLRAKKERLRRLYNRIYNLILNNEKHCLFITFTFTNDVLKSTNENTRLRYIKKYLNEQTKEYILNRDYGKNNDREHYHAIALPKYKILYFNGVKQEGYIINFKTYKYGQIDAVKINQLERYKKANKTLKEIAESLTQHATKNSTRESKIIYSRCQKTNSIFEKINEYRKQTRQ